MGDIAGFPYLEAEFTKEGALLAPPDPKQIADFVTSAGATDLLVISHGWNNDMDEARTLYRDFFGHARKALQEGMVPGAASRRFAVLGVLWPSKKFAEEDLIPGGGAGLGGAEDSAIGNRLEQLGQADPSAAAALGQARGLLDRLEHDSAAQRRFVDLVRSVVPRPKDTTDDASDQLFALPGDELLDMLSAPMLTLTPPSEESGGAAGGVATAAAGAQGQTAGLLDLGSGIKAGARRFLNFTTYYQMKERAGQVGAGGLNSVLRHLRTHGPAVRLHLIGHSFGGRLVAAAADGPGDAPAVRIDSLTLLQAAFSHNGFAPRFDGTHDGFFRKIVAERKVAGPIVVTYTVNDKAVGLAYPLSSRLARQQSSALGDANDPYGGIGRNGAVKTPEARGGELLAAGGPYAFAPGAIYNLRADAYITEHNDVARPETAYAMLSAVTAT